jgi:predicted nucleic acid-binding protein
VRVAAKTLSIRLSLDPDDDIFLETAVDGRATILVTGDKTDHHLAIGTVQGMSILSASAAVAQLEAQLEV